MTPHNRDPVDPVDPLDPLMNLFVCTLLVYIGKKIARLALIMFFFVIS